MEIQASGTAPPAAEELATPPAAATPPISPPSRFRRVRRRAAGIGCWVGAVALAAFAVMRVFGLERTWYLSTLVAFTPYVTILAVLFVPTTILGRRWWTVGLTVTAAIALVATQVPRAVGGGPDPGTGPRIHVLTSNMKIGAADPARIVALVRSHQTDLLALDEYTPAAQRALAAAGIGSLLRYSAQTPIPGATGSALFSRYPLRDTGYRPLAGGFGQEYATVLVPGALPLDVEAVHTHAPADPSAYADWATSLGQEPTDAPDGPVRLLLGDFNATLDHHRLRTLLDTGYRDAASQMGEGLDTTWPYDGRPVPPITLDHVFADRRIGIVWYGTAQVTGTDHKALYATLTLPAG